MVRRCELKPGRPPGTNGTRNSLASRVSFGGIQGNFKIQPAIIVNLHILRLSLPAEVQNGVCPSSMCIAGCLDGDRLGTQSRSKLIGELTEQVDVPTSRSVIAQ